MPSSNILLNARYTDLNEDPRLANYGYVPTTWICGLFVALYSISTLLHIAQATRYRLWWLLPTAALAGLLEIMGWSGRLWSGINPYSDSAFTMQITLTIIGPTPLLAADFIIFGLIVPRLGEQYSRLSGMWYAKIFLTCDSIALIVQAVGGGIASSATTLQGTVDGGHIMLGGIVFQLAVAVLYSLLALEYLTRWKLDKPLRTRVSTWERRNGNVAMDARMKTMLVGLGLLTLFIIVRSVYRTIELAGGWRGHIIRTQVYFNVLDGAMIVLAMFTLNLFHPGYLLPPRSQNTCRQADLETLTGSPSDGSRLGEPKAETSADA